MKNEKIPCSECGRVVLVPVGHLTEEGKLHYRCHVCSEGVLERRHEEKQIGDRKVLID